MNREDWIDEIKGFAIILVVLGHIIDGCVARGLVLGKETQIWSFAYDAIYSFHMPLFIFLSGYLFDKYILHNHKKLVNKVINLSLLYFCISCIYIGVRLLFASDMKSEVNAHQFILLPISPVGPFWYLWIIILYYCFFGLLNKKLTMRSPYILFFVVSVLAEIYSNVLTSNIYQFLFYLLFFDVGTKYDSFYYHFQRKKQLVIVGVVLFGVYNSLIDIQWKIADSVVEVGVTLLFVCCITSFVRTHCSDIKALSYIGRNTLVIYLYHVFFVTAFCVLIAKMKLTGSIMIIVGFVIGLCGPLLISTVFEKMNMKKILFAPADYIHDKLM